MAKKIIANESSSTAVSLKILEKARQLFNTMGIRNTTMDDLAKALGISKKTLYKEFANKSELVYFFVKSDLSALEDKIKTISTNCEDAIEELLQIAVLTSSNLQLYHPYILRDISKFYPETLALIEAHKQNFGYQSTLHNLRKGINQGLYRKDLNLELATSIRLHLSLLPFELNNRELNTNTIYKEILAYNLHAICTEKGIVNYQKLLKKITL